jgi:hypothetical protein
MLTDIGRCSENIILRASLKTLIGSLRKSGLAAYTRNPLVNGFLE